MKTGLLVLVTLIVMYAGYRLERVISMRQHADAQTGWVLYNGTKMSITDAIIKAVIDKGDPIDAFLIQHPPRVLWVTAYLLLGTFGGLVYGLFWASGGRVQQDKDMSWAQLPLRTLLAGMLGGIAYYLVLPLGTQTIQMPGGALRLSRHEQLAILPVLAGMFAAPFVHHLRDILDSLLGGVKKAFGKFLGGGE